jgi:hypothetical protein
MAVDESKLNVFLTEEQDPGIGRQPGLPRYENPSTYFEARP